MRTGKPGAGVMPPGYRQVLRDAFLGGLPLLPGTRSGLLVQGALHGLTATPERRAQWARIMPVIAGGLGLVSLLLVVLSFGGWLPAWLAVSGALLAGAGAACGVLWKVSARVSARARGEAVKGGVPLDDLRGLMSRVQMASHVRASEGKAYLSLPDLVLLRAAFAVAFSRGAEGVRLDLRKDGAADLFWFSGEGLGVLQPVPASNRDSVALLMENRHGQLSGIVPEGTEVHRAEQGEPEAGLRRLSVWFGARA